MNGRSARRSARRRCARRESTRPVSATRSPSGTSHAEQVIQTETLGTNSGALMVRFVAAAGGASGVHQRTGHERRLARRRRRRRRRLRLPAGARPRRRPRAPDGHGPVLRRHVPVRVELVRQHRAAVRHQRPVPPDAPVHRRRCRTPTCCASAGTTAACTSPTRCSRRGTTTPTSANHATPTTGSGCSRSDRPATSNRSTPTAAPWVSFANVEKQTTTGPAGPHMMLFDPSVPLEPGEH